MTEEKNYNNNNNEDIQIIEQYLENKLTPAESKDIEQRIANDTDFKNLFENYQKAIKSIKIFGHQQLKEKLKQIKPNRFQTERSELMSTYKNRYSANKPVRFMLLRVAAVFFGLLFLSLPVYYIAFHKSTSDRIYDNYFTPYNDIITEKGNAANAENSFNAAMFYYNNKKYVEANVIFSNIFKKASNNDTILFYYGISLFAEKKTIQAIGIFKKLKEDKSSIFNNYGMTDWYLALAYIKAKDKSNAKKILNELVNKNNDYSIKGQEILKKL